MIRFARYSLAPAAFFGGIVSALAAPPAQVVTDLTMMKTDGVEMGTLVLLAIVAVAALMFLKKCLGR